MAGVLAAFSVPSSIYPPLQFPRIAVLQLDTVTDVSTKFTPEGNDKGTVDVKFTAFGKQTAMTYAMVKTARGWKIDNISWGAKRGDLRTLLAHLKNGGQMSN